MTTQGKSGVGNESGAGVPDHGLLRMERRFHRRDAERGGRMPRGEAVVRIRIRSLHVGQSLQPFGRTDRNAQRLHRSQAMVARLIAIPNQRQSNRRSAIDPGTRPREELREPIIGANKGSQSDDGGESNEAK